MPKKILICHSSPRKGGNSDILADRFADGARAAGHQITQLPIGQLSISGCLACEYCHEHDNKCLIDDDMRSVYPQLATADCIVFAAPLYYYTLPTQLKAVIDRFYAIDDGSFKKECVLLMTAMDDKENTFAAAAMAYQLAMVDYLGWKDCGQIFAGGVSDIGAINGHPALEQAYQLGLHI